MPATTNPEVTESPMSRLLRDVAPSGMIQRSVRRWILRADAGFLLVASAGGFTVDVLGSFFALGPEARLLHDAPGAGIGLIEAHGLAFIVGVVLWRAAPHRAWHFAAAAVHILLGTANVAFWEFFLAADLLSVGYVTTALHWSFVVLQLWAAATAHRHEAKLSPEAAALRA